MKTQAYYTAIISEDYEKTLKFYEDVLGFHPKHVLERPVGEVTILENEDGAKLEIFAPLKIQAMFNSEPGFHALRTNVPSLDEAIKEFKEKGIEILNGPVDMATGKAVVIKDPNGVLITVMEHIKK